MSNEGRPGRGVSGSSAERSAQPLYSFAGRHTVQKKVQIPHDRYFCPEFAGVFFHHAMF